MPREMTATEYAKALDRLGVSNRRFCLVWLGVDDRTGRDWKSGETAVPGSVAAFLRLALALKLDVEAIEKLIGVN